jgi:multisubunit Na+/H+ antiporter MnhF subunit
MNIFIGISIFVLLVSIVLAFIRFIKGPAVTDRILSLDTITIMITAVLVFLSLFFERSIYIDVAFIFGVISFIGITIFGRFLEKGI